MTSATARHLSRLLSRATPITLTTPEDDVAHIVCGPLDWQYGRDLIDPVLRRHTAAAQAEEIRAAARERREAYAYASTVTHASTTQCRVYRHGYAAILWEIALPEIEAVIEADNARRLAEYEAYRAACEQGVAIPPPTT